MSIEQPNLESPVEQPSYTEDDLTTAQNMLASAEEAFNAVDFEADDFNEEEAKRLKTDWEEKRAQYREIAQALGKEQ